MENLNKDKFLVKDGGEIPMNTKNFNKQERERRKSSDKDKYFKKDKKKSIMEAKVFMKEEEEKKPMKGKEKEGRI